jgi:tRNA(Ile)-lysidine synthase
MALMALLADVVARRGGALRAATVDHGLRPDAAAEAALAADTAAAMGIPHDTLSWRDGDTAGWDGRGNLQARARAARLAALRGWAGAHELTRVCLGHTMDDQAETVLLRLARGSGVDGLAGMAEARRDNPGGFTWLRPLLDTRRSALRDLLRARGIGWAEDPSNADTRFDRVRARAALADPALAGMDVPTLAATAARMAAARTVLWQAAHAAARAHATVDHGGIGFDRAAFAGLPDDTRRRLLAAAVRHVAGLAYRPRFAALVRAEAAALAGTPATVAGCVLSAARGRIWVDREPAALGGRTAPAPGPWDGRWRIDGPDCGHTLAALGPAGLAQCPGWRNAGLRRRAILTAPGVWDGARLVAAPTLPGCGPTAPDWSSRPLWDTLAFRDALRPD